MKKQLSTTSINEAICSTKNLHQQKASQPHPIKIFAIFFHPAKKITALGGAEKRFIETLKIFCKQKNVEIAVLEPNPGILEQMEIPCKKITVSLNFRGKGWLSTYIEWILWATKAFLEAPSIVKRGKPNVVFIPNNTLPNLTLGVAISLLFQLPMCVVAHHVDVIPKSERAKNHSFYDDYRSINYTKMVSLVKTVASYIMFPLLKKADTIITVSNFTAKVLVNTGIAKNKIHVSGNAVDFKYIKKIAPCHTTKVYDGVFIGRIAKEKGIFDLLDVWRLVINEKKNAKLLIIGSGIELAKLKTEVANAKLENNIAFEKQCSDEKLFSLLKSSKVFVFPSLFEGWGMAVAEALACGIPVVAYDIPALREVFGKCQSVFLVPVKDKKKMAQILLEVLNDEDRKFSEISMEYAEKFEWTNVALTDLKAIIRIVKRKT